MIYAVIAVGVLYLQLIASPSAAVGDVACLSQQRDIQSMLSEDAVKHNFSSKYVFSDDAKPAVLLTWAGPNSKTLLVITLLNVAGAGVATDADVYRSTDDGRSFARITGQLSPGGGPLRLLSSRAVGLQRNLADPRRLYLACAGAGGAGNTDLHVSLDNGATWRLASLPFAITEPFVFHETSPDLALAQTGATVYVTQDGGFSWRLLRNGVFKASWGSSTDEANAIYIVHDAAPLAVSAVAAPAAAPANAASVIRDGAASASAAASVARRPLSGRSLLKTVNFGATWRQLASNIYSYTGRGNFLFVSTAATDDSLSRRLEVSADYGATGFHRTSLPAVTPDQFFSVLAVDNGLAFVHVDAGDLSGHGTLYTSDVTGRLYSRSLERHLYPPMSQASDLYRVASMPGTYLTTVLHADHTMHTVVSHDRGAVWDHLDKPAGVECPDAAAAAGLPCYLQVASQFSLASGVLADAPASVASAPGLVVAHGNAGASLTTANVDVFVSSDGGYSWYRALVGPHRVQIGNNGGFIAAVSMATASPQVIKFSTDAGRCWHSYRFTNETYRFTGFISEPGNRAMSVAIWGYSDATRHWRIFVVDFASLVTRRCSPEDDYEAWLSNGAVNYGSASHRACVLGAKRTVMRLKADSLCANSYSYEPAKTVERCACTRDDFGCEYGFARQLSGRECVRDVASVPVLDVCADDGGTGVQRIVSQGYRKLPGNQCVGGFAPNKTQQVALQGKLCSELPHSQHQLEAELRKQRRIADAARLMESLRADAAAAEAASRGRHLGVLLPLAVALPCLLAVVLALVIAARLRERRRRRLAFHYSAVSSAGRREDVVGTDAEQLLTVVAESDGNQAAS